MGSEVLVNIIPESDPVRRGKKGDNDLSASA